MLKSYIHKYISPLLYIFSFIAVYYFYLNPVFEYSGQYLYNDSIGYIILAAIFSIMPFIFFKGVRAISSIFALFIYTIVYIPTIVTFAFALNRSLMELLMVLFVFLLSMSLLFIIDRFKVHKRTFSNNINFQYILFTCLIILCLVIYQYRNNISFVGFSDIYEKRFESNDVQVSSLISYLTMMLTSSFYPILIVYGLFKKKIFFTYLGLIGTIISYLIFAAKGALFTPFILYIVYWLVSRVGLKSFHNYLLGGIACSLIIILCLYHLYPNNIIIGWTAAIYFNRTIGMSGVLNYLYYEFFLTHPFTYLSHVNLINYLTDLYPYGDNSLGSLIGNEYLGGYTTNANANFWAMDGLAGFGLFGVLLITIIFSIICCFLNSFLGKYDIKFLLVLFVPFIMTLCNVSLFTALLSGGGILMFLLLFYVNEFKSVVKK